MYRLHCGDSRAHDAVLSENEMQRCHKEILAITEFSTVKQRYRCRYDCINSGIWFGIYYAFWYNATLMCGALHSFYRFSIYRSILVQPILFSTQGNGCTTKHHHPKTATAVIGWCLYIRGDHHRAIPLTVETNFFCQKTIHPAEFFYSAASLHNRLDLCTQ